MLESSGVECAFVCFWIWWPNAPKCKMLLTLSSLPHMLATTTFPRRLCRCPNLLVWDVSVFVDLDGLIQDNWDWTHLVMLLMSRSNGIVAQDHLCLCGVKSAHCPQSWYMFLAFEIVTRYNTWGGPSAAWNCHACWFGLQRGLSSQLPLDLVYPDVDPIGCVSDQCALHYRASTLPLSDPSTP